MDALSSSDYTAITDDVITFDPSETSKLVNVTLTNDQIVENNEMFEAFLTTDNPPQVGFLISTANITITDTDKGW